MYVQLHIREMETDTATANTFLGTIPSYSPSTFTSLIGEIRKEEVVQGIKQLNVWKSPGPDGLPTEFYQLDIDEVKPAHFHV